MKTYFILIMMSSMCSRISKTCNMLLCKHDPNSIAELSNNQNELVNDILSDKTKENTSFFSLDGETHDAKVVYIYDGDTMHVVFKKFGQFYRWNCRIMGVDTPELKTKNQYEKKHGLKVRDATREALMDKIVKIKCFTFDKYGRLLIDVVMPESMQNKNSSEPLMLSTWLIENNYAYAYDGGTKQSWDSIDLNF